MRACGTESRGSQAEVRAVPLRAPAVPALRFMTM